MAVFRLGDSYAGVAFSNNIATYFHWLRSLRNTLLKELDAVSLNIGEQLVEAPPDHSKTRSSWRDDALCIRKGKVVCELEIIVHASKNACLHSSALEGYVEYVEAQAYIGFPEQDAVDDEDLAHGLIGLAREKAGKAEKSKDPKNPYTGLRWVINLRIPPASADDALSEFTFQGGVFDTDKIEQAFTQLINELVGSDFKEQP